MPNINIANIIYITIYKHKLTDIMLLSTSQSTILDVHNPFHNIVFAITSSTFRNYDIIIMSRRKNIIPNTNDTNIPCYKLQPYADRALNLFIGHL